MATATKPSEAMIEALEANEPFPAHADELMLFGQLIGSWDVGVRFFDPEGNVTRERRGEWHFGWVLEGRVIQDVLISPPREGRDAGQASHEYGTTLRAYDPKIDAWRVTVGAPGFGATVNPIAREHGNEIGLERRARDNSLSRG